MGRHRCPHCGGIIVIVKEEVDEDEDLDELDDIDLLEQEKEYGH